jgi:hypothetical protein
LSELAKFASWPKAKGADGNERPAKRQPIKTSYARFDSPAP